jgi:alkanesulfonate monooxygenase SsuD/methylene tetrahydromethanopterin reductase-like flavin-dependent oxidoreductase (luciferase family)
MAQTYDQFRGAWSEAGRSGQPYLLSGFWYALGPDAENRLRDFVARYLGYFGDDMAKRTAASMRTWSPSAIRDALEAFAEIGTDEMTLVPVSSDLDQLDRLADVIAGL